MYLGLVSAFFNHLQQVNVLFTYFFSALLNLWVIDDRKLPIWSKLHLSFIWLKYTFLLMFTLIPQFSVLISVPLPHWTPFKWPFFLHEPKRISSHQHLAPSTAAKVFYQRLHCCCSSRRSQTVAHFVVLPDSTTRQEIPPGVDSSVSVPQIRPLA